MSADKLRYYLGGLVFIILTLVCSLSVCQQYYAGSYDRNIMTFDIAAMIICLPLAIWMLVKAERSPVISTDQPFYKEAKDTIGNDHKLSKRGKTLVVVILANLLIILGFLIYALWTGNMYPFIVLFCVEFVLIIVLRLYTARKGRK